MTRAEIEALRDRLRELIPWEPSVRSDRPTSQLPSIHADAVDALHGQAADLLDALLKQEPVGRVVAIAGDLHEFRVIEWGKKQPDVGAPLYAAPVPAVPDATYATANPLGGPASMFRTIASRIEAGEPLAEVLEDYGVAVTSSQRGAA